jgi:hypothetical protein
VCFPSEIQSIMPRAAGAFLQWLPTTSCTPHAARARRKPQVAADDREPQPTAATATDGGDRDRPPQAVSRPPLPTAAADDREPMPLAVSRPPLADAAHRCRRRNPTAHRAAGSRPDAAVLPAAVESRL